MNDLFTILTNPAMPDIVRLHHCPEDEALEPLAALNDQIRLPVPYEVNYCGRVHDGAKVAHSLSIAYSAHVINLQQGFYFINPLPMIAVVRLNEIEDITNEFRHAYNDKLEEIGYDFSIDFHETRNRIKPALA